MHHLIIFFFFTYNNKRIFIIIYRNIMQLPQLKKDSWNNKFSRADTNITIHLVQLYFTVGSVFTYIWFKLSFNSLLKYVTTVVLKTNYNFIVGQLILLQFWSMCLFLSAPFLFPISIDTLFWYLDGCPIAKLQIYHLLISRYSDLQSVFLCYIYAVGHFSEL